MGLLFKQNVQLFAECDGKRHECLHGKILLAGFHASNGTLSRAHFFCQIFLGYLCFFA